MDKFQPDYGGIESWKGDGIKKAGSTAQSIVEFAPALPVILIILFGIMECGRLLLFYASVTSSREVPGTALQPEMLADIRAHFEDCDGIRTSTKSAAILVPVKTKISLSTMTTVPAPLSRSPSAQ
jgi:hypothetical protein